MMLGVKCARLISNRTIIQKSFYYKLNVNNFNDYFTSHLDKCKESIAKRNCNVNLDDLSQGYKKCLNIMLNIENLEKEKEDVVTQIKEAGKLADTPLIEKIKEKGRFVRNLIKESETSENNLRKEFLPKLKALPAFLDPNTPLEEKIIFESEGAHTVGKNHLELCASQIELRSQSLGAGEPVITAYLTDNLAKLETHLYYIFLDHLKQLKTHQHLMHPDMVKQFVADASLDKSEMGLEILQAHAEEPTEEGIASNLVLTGSSLPGFLAYISTLNMQSPNIPSGKFYTLGRNYKTGGNIHHGLYNMSQTIQAELFSITSNQCTNQATYEEQKEFMLNFYKLSGLPFKMVEAAAKDLSVNESQRTDFYIWSTGFNQYFKCGYLRSLDDHVSRKLSLFHKEDNCFFKMTHGIIFKLPTIMAAIIEQEQTDQIISSEDCSLKLFIDIDITKDN